MWEAGGAGDGQSQRELKVLILEPLVSVCLENPPARWAIVPEPGAVGQLRTELVCGQLTEWVRWKVISAWR